MVKDLKVYLETGTPPSVERKNEIFEKKLFPFLYWERAFYIFRKE